MLENVRTIDCIECFVREGQGPPYVVINDSRATIKIKIIPIGGELRAAAYIQIIAPIRGSPWFHKEEAWDIPVDDGKRPVANLWIAIRR